MLTSEVYVFFWSILIGAFLTLIFDFFRLTRRKRKTRDIIVYIQDILFGFIVTITIIISAFIINSGDLRGYMFIGYALRFNVLFITLKQNSTKYFSEHYLME